MKRPDNLHSQLVGWAKIILPLCALALLSTLFLFSRDTGEPSEATITRVEAIAREQRLSAPEFSGVTDEGAIIVLSAKTARPGDAGPDTVSIDEIRMKLDYPDGSDVEVNASQGQIDGRAQIAHLFGLARVETSNGYAMETNGLTANLETGVIFSDGLLEIRAPFGTLTAGNVTFQTSDEASGQQILFTNGVRLLYMPQNQ